MSATFWQRRRQIKAERNRTDEKAKENNQELNNPNNQEPNKDETPKKKQKTGD